MKMDAYRCKKQLAIVWFLVAVVLGAVMMVQSVLGHYGDKSGDAWSWLLPNLLPTLSLMISVFAADAIAGDAGAGRTIDSFIFRLTFAVSVVYLGGVAASIFLSPLSTEGPIALMKTSNLWLGPMQGLTAASLGIFFVKPQKKANGS